MITFNVKFFATTENAVAEPFAMAEISGCVGHVYVVEGWRQSNGKHEIIVYPKGLKNFDTVEVVHCCDTLADALRALYVYMAEQHM